MELTSKDLRKIKLCWLFFIALNFLTLGLMLWTLFSERWVKLEAEEDLISFEGNIMSFKQASLNLEDYEDKPYNEAADDWCMIEENDYYKAGCSLFSGLVVTCWLFIIFEVLAAGYIITNIVALSVFFCHKNILGLSLLSVVFSNIWQFLAVLFYSGINSLSFDDDCDKFRDKENPQNLCAGDGPKLALGVFFFMVLIGIFQCVFIGFALNLKRNLYSIIPKKIIPYPGTISTNPPLYSNPSDNSQPKDPEKKIEPSSRDDFIVHSFPPTSERNRQIIDPEIRFDVPSILDQEQEEDH